MLATPKSSMQWRSGQTRFLEWFERQEKPYIIWEAPPGSGKSPVGVAVGLSGYEDSGRPAAILVGTKALQEQYEREYDLPMAKGRSNYGCVLTGNPSCEDAPCTYNQKCEFRARRYRGEDGQWAFSKAGCLYYDAKVEAVEAEVSLHNYAYFLTETMGGGSWFARHHSWLVLDEADTVEAHVRNASTLEMRWRLVAGWEGCPSYPTSTSPRVWNEWADSADRFAEGFRAYMSEPPTRDEIALNQRIAQLKRSASIISATWPHMLVTREEWGYKLQPIVAGQLAMERLITFGDKVLFMSGTIGDPYVFAHQLGVPADQCVVFRSPSTFPVENRPIVFSPAGKMGRKDNQIKEVVAALDRVMEVEDGPGVVHTVSIKRAAEVREYSRYKERLIVHGFSRNPLADYLESAHAGSNKVLVSPSVGRGTDFIGDLAHWQVIIKVPYPDLGDPVVKARVDMPGGW